MKREKIFLDDSPSSACPEFPQGWWESSSRQENEKIGWRKEGTKGGRGGGGSANRFFVKVSFVRRNVNPCKDGIVSEGEIA